MNKILKKFKKLEFIISYRSNRLASNNKIVFYLFRIITFTAEWWMFLFYGLILLSINKAVAYDCIKMGLIAYSIHYPLYFLIKNNVKRKRPFVNNLNIKCLVKPPDQYSLPSGHSSASTISTLIIFFFFPGIKLLIIWPVLAGLSRVVLGVHFISDVLFGIFLGYICFYISYVILFKI
jgi:undecaprenyl-diphosphatase